MDNITFDKVDVLDIHREGYKKLNNSLFPATSMSHSWIQWYFSRTENNIGVRTYGAFDQGKLIGIWSVEPRTFIYCNMPISIGRCFCTGIDKDYRRQGLFVKLSKYALACEKEYKQYEYIVGFPTKGRPIIPGHLKAGWYSVQEIEIRQLLFEDIKDTRTKLFDFQYCIKYAPALKGSFVLSPEYCIWRWENHPENHYITLRISMNDRVVLKSYRDQCHIVDVNGDKSKIMPLLNAAKGLCVKHCWSKITVWCANSEYYRDVFEDVGFKSDVTNSRIVMLAYNINAHNPLILAESHIQNGIEEIY